MTKVVIFGTATQDWLTALAPDAPVWKQLPQVESVIHLGEGQEPPDSLRNDSKGVVLIPLKERHVFVRPAEFRSLTSSDEIIQTLSNKRYFQQAMRERGFAQFVPEVWYHEQTLIFPCLIKREDLSAGRGVYRLENAYDLMRIRQDPIYSGHSYFFEQQIPGEEEFVTHIVAKNGRILLMHTFCYSMGKENVIRVPDNYEKIFSVELPLHFKTILGLVIKSFNYSGPACINFKVHNGAPKIFEINPRMGGSLMMTDNLKYLVDVLGALIDNAIDEPVE
jgi:carbamoylphosphate synthase large subunit